MQVRPIRVLVTAFAPVPGSSPHAAAVLAVAEALRAEIEIVTVKTDGLSHMERLEHARMLRVPLGLGSAAEQRRAFGRAIARQLDSQPYDAVHVRGPIEGAVVARRAASQGFRFVYEMATFADEAEGPDAERGWESAHEACCEAADLILVATNAAARALGERGHAGKVAVISPGVDVNTYDWRPGGTGIGSRVLYLGSFDADRDLATLLQALHALRHTRPVEALLAGDSNPDRRERLRRMVTAFDLEGVVAVHGEPKPEMLPMIIGAADVCVAPASATPRFHELGDLPQPLLEYLACRRPVVAAGVPGLSEIIRDDKEALLYEPGDERTLTQALVTLLDHAPQRERLVAAGYTRVRENFSEGARRRRLAEVYEMLFAGSQACDAWRDGFERFSTGMVEIPSDLIASDTTGAIRFEEDAEDLRRVGERLVDAELAAAAAGLVAVGLADDPFDEELSAEPTSIQSELSGEQTSPAASLLDSTPAPPTDTNPSLTDPGELGSAPTHVAPAPEPPTEEAPRPPPDDSEEGPSHRSTRPAADDSDTGIRMP
jgi:glycosyltransferase involved in cell wall biosynthesis